MSSLWFDKTESQECSSIYSNVFDTTGAPNFMSILAAVGPQLPLLQPVSLSYDKFLGRGSSFEVSREMVTRVDDQEWEPHYVAVKHIVIAESSLATVRKQYDSVMRELRVLTHPGLKDNNYIIPILAYGWTRSLTGMRPYLVMHYSNHGTLREYLRRVEPELSQRHEFALDVACGLEAIHESKIIHGDLKPHNILVFDCGKQHRLQIAKLADFGGSLFELDEAQAASYGGTALYKARYLGEERNITFRSLYQADIYAFGITLWETMNNGHDYIDQTWLVQGQSRLEFLKSIWTKEENDAVLRRARVFCSTLLQENRASYGAICEATRTVFDLTLTDDPNLGSTTGQIVEILSMGLKRECESPSIPRIGPPMLRENNQTSMSTLGTPVTANLASPVKSDHTPQGFTGYKLNLVTSPNLVIRKAIQQSSVPEQMPNLEVENRVAVLPRPGPAAPAQFKPAGLNIFLMSMALDPPWEIQLEVAKLFSYQLRSKQSQQRPHYFDACLQLALCYHLGYGVQPDLHSMCHYLTLSLKGHNVTRAIYKQVVLALGPTESGDVDRHFQTELDHELELQTNRETYFSTRVWMYQRFGFNQNVPDGLGNLRQNILSLMDLLSVDDIPRLSTSLRDHLHNDEEVSVALTLACKHGNASAAIKLSEFCDTFVVKPEAPTPLHWLIMFNAQEIEHVAKALVQGAPPEQNGPCKGLLDWTPTAGDGIFFFAEHCLELFGTPLHWAVRARYLGLVRLLCNMGSNVNARWSTSAQVNTDVQRPRLPYLSPLDIAVQFHMPEVIKALVGFGAEWIGTSLAESHTAFHCVGLACLPFSRYIIHGDCHRAALDQTIAIIQDLGYDINELDPNGYNALMIVLRDCDCDTYIVECLLNAGSRTDLANFDYGSNAADIAVSASLHRRYNVGGLALIAPRVPDVNQVDKSGRNALHTAAIIGNSLATAILCDLDSIDIELVSSSGDTALHFAAIFGSVDVLTLLLERGACLETANATGKTALHLAVLNKRSQAAELLLTRGANVIFTSTPRSLGGNILHAATAGVRSQETMLSDLLTAHPRLRSTGILNGTNSEGFTPLHKATYFGDYDAVNALLEHGAICTLRDTWNRTPLSLVSRLIDKIRLGNFELEHDRIRQQSLHVQRTFLASLDEIKRVLERYSSLA